VPITQLVDYVYNDRFPAETHEKALDKLTMICQALGEVSARTLRFEEGEVLDGTLALAGRLGNVLKFNETTGGIEFISVDDLISLVDAGVVPEARAARDVALQAATDAETAETGAQAAQTAAEAAQTGAEAAEVAAEAARDVAVAATATKVDKAGDTMTGPLTLSGDATNALHAVPKQQVDARVGTEGGLSFRNLIINGRGSINQRGYVSGAATTVANQYTLDRWRVVVSGQNLTFTSSLMTAPAGGVEQVIEGSLNSGGDHVLNWVGTATATVNGVARTQGEVFSLTAGANVTVRFTGGSFINAQLERGTVRTAYEIRPPGIELMLCQRYWQQTYNQGVAPGTITGVGAMVNISFNAGDFNDMAYVIYPVQMRATPTVTIYNTVTGATGSIRDEGGSANRTGTVVDATARSTRFAASGMTAGRVHSWHYTADAEL
jgi:hypothetical protein